MPADSTAPTCAACLRLATRTRPDAPWAHLFIADLEETALYLYEHQRYEGWCVLFLRDHAEHLADLPIERQSRVFADVARAAAAVRAAVAPRRLNYECLGNQLAHVHWHVIPRATPPADPEPGETVWVRPAAERNAGVTPAHAAALVARLRAAL